MMLASTHDAFALPEAMNQPVLSKGLLFSLSGRDGGHCPRPLLPRLWSFAWHSHPPPWWHNSAHVQCNFISERVSMTLSCHIEHVRQ
jgi:hypothetical protein